MRVAVTGMGTVNALAHTVDGFWEAISSGKSGVGPITHFDPSNHNTKIAAEVKDLDALAYFDKRVINRLDPFALFAVISAVQAWEQSGLGKTKTDPTRIGCVLGVGIGGFQNLEQNFITLQQRGPQRVHPMTVPKIMSNTGPSTIAIHLNIQGPCYAINTACASGTDAIGHALQFIRNGICDVIIAGGAEAIITSLPMASFNALHAMSTAYNDSPERASRPFDRDRDGFIMGEGAGIVILESLEHARKRGAKTYAELVSYGASTDAVHITAPHSDGRGAIQAIHTALNNIGLEAEKIDYINAHGTATPVNDRIETKAIKKAFAMHARKLKISSTKSMTGHCICAAGAVEAIVCVKALENQFLPPTINYENPDPECDLDYVPNKGYPSNIEYAMSNSLGFGGHNSVIIMKKFKGE